MTEKDAGGLSCAQVRELAPELGLGVLPGRQRADALAHLQGCASCRALVEEMAELGDSLLALGPEIEPPAGFEDRLLAKRAAVRRAPSRHRRRLVPAVAAAAVAVAAAVGLVLGLGAQGGEPGFRVDHPAAVHALGGRELSVAALRHGNQELGQVFVYAGRPSWVFMTVDTEARSQRLTCELQTKQGTTVVLGSFTTSSGYGSWGSTVSLDPTSIRGVQLVDADAHTVAAATL